MDETAGARDPQEQTAKTWYLWKWHYGPEHGDWPDPLREPCELAPDELDLLHSQVPGHRWNGWRRLTGDEDYYAACSCGWRGAETDYVSPMLGQVQEHLDAVRARERARCHSRERKRTQGWDSGGSGRPPKREAAMSWAPTTPSRRPAGS